MMNPAVALPYRDEIGIKGKYLYAIGGYHSTDTGCPAWGTSDPSDIRFIGDHLGDLVITYADGSADTVPLILGYTLWLHSTWMETPPPLWGKGRMMPSPPVLWRPCPSTARGTDGRSGFSAWLCGICP